jgi:hypothetical protein
MADQTLDILIRTKAELAGAQAAARALEQQIGKAKALGQDYGALKTQLDKVNASIAAAAPASEAAASALQGFAARAFTAASAVLAIKQALGEFAQQEAATTGALQALANQGGLSAANIALIEESAQKYQALGIAGESWLRVVETLLSRGGLAENLQRDLEAIGALTALMKGDAQGAAQVWTRALNGSFRQLNLLGIEVDKNADLATQLQQALRQLSERGAGLLESQSRTLSGQLNLVRLALNNVFEGVGALITRTPLLRIAFTGLTGVLRLIADLLPEVDASAAQITNRLPIFKRRLDEVAEAGESAAEGGLDDLQKKAGSIKDAFDLATESLRAHQAMADQISDAELAAEIAAIDAEEAGAAATPENKASFARRRLAARNVSADRKDARDRAFLESQLALNQRKTAEEQVGIQNAAAATEKTRASFIAAAGAAGMAPSDVTPERLRALEAGLQMEARDPFKSREEIEKRRTALIELGKAHKAVVEAERKEQQARDAAGATTGPLSLESEAIRSRLRILDINARARENSTLAERRRILDSDPDLATARDAFLSGAMPDISGGAGRAANSSQQAAQAVTTIAASYEQLAAALIEAQRKIKALEANRTP